MFSKVRFFPQLTLKQTLVSCIDDHTQICQCNCSTTLSPYGPTFQPKFLEGQTFPRLKWHQHLSTQLMQLLLLPPRPARVSILHKFVFVQPRQPDCGQHRWWLEQFHLRPDFIFKSSSETANQNIFRQSLHSRGQSLKLNSICSYCSGLFELANASSKSSLFRRPKLDTQRLGKVFPAHHFLEALYHRNH